MRVYCSGPMTSIPGHNIPAFNAAAKLLRKQGHFVINPAELSAKFGTLKDIETSFKIVYGIPIRTSALKDTSVNEMAKIARSIMDSDLAAVRSCNAIYLLHGWEKSRGAKKELAEALKHGLKVMQEGGAE